MCQYGVQINIFELQLFLHDSQGLLSHLFEQAEERGTENVVKVLDVKALSCLHKVALELVNVVKGCDLHWIDQLVVPDLCQQYLSQVFLELKSAFDYVDKVLGRLVGAVDNVFEKINLRM